MANSTWNANDIEDQTGRRVVVTGATSGIGKEAARVLAGKNASVVIAARNAKKADAVATEIRIEDRIAARCASRASADSRLADRPTERDRSRP